MRSVYFGGRRVLVYSGLRGAPASPDGYGQTQAQVALKMIAEEKTSENESISGTAETGTALELKAEGKISTDSAQEDTAAEIALEILAKGNVSAGSLGEARAEISLEAEIGNAAISTESEIVANTDSVLLEAKATGRLSSEDTLGEAISAAALGCKATAIVAQPVNVNAGDSTIALDMLAVPFYKPPAGNYTSVYVSMYDADHLAIEIWVTINSGAVNIIWGDGATTRRTSTGFSAHTYAQRGDYAILIEPETNTVYTLGRYSTTTLSNYSLFGLVPGAASTNFEAFDAVGYGLSVLNGNTFKGGKFKKITILDGPSTVNHGVFFSGVATGGEIELPLTITYIGTANFPDTLGKVIIRAVTPPENHGFNGMSNPGLTVPVYVPAEAVRAYKEHADWSAHADYIFAIEE